MKPPAARTGYHVVISRTVSNEEQVSIEFTRRTREAAEADLAGFMAAIQTHRETWNARVLVAQQQQLELLRQRTLNQEEELARVAAEVTAAQEQLAEAEANGDASGAH